MMIASPLLKERLQDSADSFKEVCYSDRYLNSPLSVALLAQVFAGLRDSTGAAAKSLKKVEVITAHLQSKLNSARFLNQDWENADMRNKVLIFALEKCQFSCSPMCQEKNTIEHARTLSLFFNSGVRFRIRLDEGISFWSLKPPAQGGGAIWHRFDETAQQQANKLAQINPPLFGRSKTYIVITKL